MTPRRCDEQDPARFDRLGCKHRTGCLEIAARFKAMACDRCEAYERIDAIQQQQDTDALIELLRAVFHPVDHRGKRGYQ